MPEQCTVSNVNGCYRPIKREKSQARHKFHKISNLNTTSKMELEFHAVKQERNRGLTIVLYAVFAKSTANCYQNANGVICWRGFRKSCIHHVVVFIPDLHSNIVLVRVNDCCCCYCQVFFLLVRALINTHRVDGVGRDFE